ncbi:hypothetical protein [Streptomyces sp. NPDC088762]|uniref:hypothetical protein n=1 Tax=Streptomyces sp. NPDC088762 TaxID=3365891 RepID=UPI0037FF22CD
MTAGRPGAAPRYATDITADDAWAVYVSQSWDDLCALVRPWRGSKGYDDVRWRKMLFRDAAQEAYDDRTCAELGITPRAERP